MMTGTLTTQRSRNLLPWFRRGPLAGLRDIEDLFERFWEEEGDGWGTHLLAPPLDLSESDKDITVHLDVPGVTAKEIDIQVNVNQLLISGERKEEKEEKGETFRSGLPFLKLFGPDVVQVHILFVRRVARWQFPMLSRDAADHLRQPSEAYCGRVDQEIGGHLGIGPRIAENSSLLATTCFRPGEGGIVP